MRQPLPSLRRSFVCQRQSSKRSWPTCARSSLAGKQRCRRHCSICKLIRAQLAARDERYSREKLAREAQLEETEQKLRVDAEAETEVLRSQAADKEEEWKSLGRWLREKREALAPALGGAAGSSSGFHSSRSSAGGLTDRSGGAPRTPGRGDRTPGRKVSKPSMKFH